MLLVAAVVGAGCSDRDAPADPGPVWPDLVLDQGSLDAGVDLAPPDLTPPDLARVDGSRDGATDLPATPWVNATVAGGADLHDVACLPGGQVFAAGNAGTMIYRAPGAGGLSFTKQAVGTTTAPVTVDLYTVTFADTTYGATAGKDYQIWETKDLGQSWGVAPQCSAFIFDTFYSLHLTAANAGFGAGIASNGQGAGYKYYGGYSWVCGPTPYPGEVFYDVFRHGGSGWIVGDTGGKIYRTEDDGATWVGYAAGTSKVLRAVTFHAGTLGVAVGEQGTIVVSDDGAGKIWTPVSAPVAVDLYGVALVDASVGWAVGDGGTLLRTTDGGKSWSVQSSGVTSRLEGICFASATEGWAAGQGGTVIYTGTGGS